MAKVLSSASVDLEMALASMLREGAHAEQHTHHPPMCVHSPFLEQLQASSQTFSALATSLLVTQAGCRVTYVFLPPVSEM